ncbi:hypothetical protein [Nesterenkonia pannonica]|uniref:hypothetical protein n=1 Tax=Nesterenkonia pannonica TaxID=1548602 RepID=UPI00216483E9|nr:hypothetical protein [Nesterenkonia pannonica]
MGFEAAAEWRAEKPDRKVLSALTGISAAWILLDLSLFGVFSTGPVSVGALVSLLLWTLCLCLLWVGVIPGATAAQAALAAILVVGYIPSTRPFSSC